MRGRSLLCALLVIGSIATFATPASAHSVFKKLMAEKYAGKKVSCTACHDPKDKKIRNSFGKLIQKQFESKTLTADWKAKKGKEKKNFEKEVMTPEFEKAFEKIKVMTVHDLIDAGFFAGIDDPNAEGGAEEENEGDDDN